VIERIDDESSALAWSTALSLRQQIADTAVSIAETEDWVADTLDRLARVRPHEAERLRARAAHARRFAARERAQAAIYRSCPGTIPAGGKGVC
jgi:hypothetical protein